MHITHYIHLVMAGCANYTKADEKLITVGGSVKH